MSAKFNDAFWRWFGKSKVIKPDGSPMALYHGTDVDFNKFDTEKIKFRFPYSFGFHFTSRPTEADAYADEGLTGAFHGGSNVKKVYVKAEKPLVIHTKHCCASMEADINRAWIIKEIVDARERGDPYDSVLIIRNHGDAEWDGINVIVFDPRQIKSATGNDGTWDADDSDIRSNPGPDPDEDDDDEDWGTPAWDARFAAKVEKSKREIFKAAGASRVVHFRRKDGAQLFLSQTSNSGKSKWQVSFIASDGVPSMHVIFKERDDALLSIAGAMGGDSIGLPGSWKVIDVRENGGDGLEKKAERILKGVSIR